jgi:hypothetical protein
MTRFWLNLSTLEHRINDLEYGPARTDAERWLGDTDLGWFDSVERMNEFIMTKMLPLLEAAWRANPHMRLGQLISNAAGAGVQDIYYIKDGKLMQGLDKAVDGEWF